jgi:hypothetical protein
VAQKRTRGRPALREEIRKSEAIGIRLTKQLRNSLEEAQKESGARSLGEEIEQRLVLSFTAVKATEVRFGGPGTVSFFEIIADFIEQIEKHGDKQHWFDNQFMIGQVKAMINAILDDLKPRQRAIPKRLRLWTDQGLVKNMGRHYGLRVLYEVKEAFAAVSKGRTLDNSPRAVRRAALPLGRRIRGSWLQESAPFTLKEFPMLERIQDAEEMEALERRSKAPRARRQRNAQRSSKTVPKGEQS